MIVEFDTRSSIRGWNSKPWLIILIAVVFPVFWLDGSTRADPYDDANGSVSARWLSITVYKLRKPKAEAGNEAAQNNLGILYREGKGITQNYSEAIKWFQRSADQGSAWGQYNLGMAYELGLGFPANQQEALKWYRLLIVNYVKTQFNSSFSQTPQVHQAWAAP